MKRLFVSLMVIGGFILFGMQAAESALMGSGKVRPDRELRRCDKIRNPERRAKCRAKARKRLVQISRGEIGGGRMKADRARLRCSKIKSLRARAACCVKVKPASHLSPKKLCKAVGPCGRIRNPKEKAACVARVRAKLRAKKSAKLRPDKMLRRCDKIRNPGRRAKCKAKVRARLERRRLRKK